MCQGLLKAFTITAREGSVLNPRFPAPVNTYNPTVHALVDAVYDALVSIPWLFRASTKIEDNATAMREARTNGRSGSAPPSETSDFLLALLIEQSVVVILTGSNHVTKLARTAGLDANSPPGFEDEHAPRRRDLIVLRGKRGVVRKTWCLVHERGTSSASVMVAIALRCS